MAAVFLVREKVDVWKLVKEKIVCLVRKIVGVWGEFYLTGVLNLVVHIR